ncbi:MAG: S8 family serine peptidase [Defluviitaleaceae bacterium]|nr:S8 family serine peptidase [Defluviitaleaceae bacterium]
MKKTMSKVLALLIALIMSTSVFVIQPAFAVELELTDDFNAIELTPEVLPQLGMGDPMNEVEFVTSTLDTSIGVVGFVGSYAITNPNAIVDVIVQFRTPPAVALRLLAEHEGSGFARLSDRSFEAEALDAHNDFNSQLTSIIGRGRSNHIEIYSRHHMIFNGVFMRVPAFMLEDIAALPEVFSVSPNVEHFAIGELLAMQLEEEMITDTIEEPTSEDEEEDYETYEYDEHDEEAEPPVQESEGYCEYGYDYCVCEVLEDEAVYDDESIVTAPPMPPVETFFSVRWHVDYTMGGSLTASTDDELYGSYTSLVEGSAITFTAIPHFEENMPLYEVYVWTVIVDGYEICIVTEGWILEGDTLTGAITGNTEVIVTFAPIDNDAVVEIILEPMTVEYVREGEYYQFTAKALNRLGNVIDDVPFMWNIVDEDGYRIEVFGISIDDGVFTVAERARLGDVNISVAYYNNDEIYTTVTTMVSLGLLIMPMSGAYVRDPLFNRAAMDLFGIDDIHSNFATGQGVRVAVFDTGIDYRHPAIAPFLNGATTLPGGNFLALDPCPILGINGYRPTGSGTSAMELSHNPPAWSATNHGTHVAGTVIAMAPDIELWSYRVIGQGPGGSQGSSLMDAMEDAYLNNMHVINLSLGNRINTPWQPNAYALNVLSLAGIVIVSAAGNDGIGGGTRAEGIGGWFSLGGGPATASLSIVVGAGEAGGRPQESVTDTMLNGVPRSINMIGHSPGFNTAGFLAYGDRNFTWFGQLGNVEGGSIAMPNGGRTNPAYPAFVQAVRTELLGGHDLTGQVAIISRGGGEFVTMRDLAFDLNADAFVLLNNQPGNVFVTGTVLNGIGPGQVLPNFSMGMQTAFDAFGISAISYVPATPVTGTINFGNFIVTTPTDRLTPFSSIGPLGPVRDSFFAPHLSVPTMQVLPDIVAPGVSIWSSNNMDLAGSDFPPYVSMGGTSMAAPAVAGIVALMREYDPSWQPYEIKARIMNTARPLDSNIPYYSVLQVGAGFVNPTAIFDTTAFATAQHPIPFSAGDGMNSGLFSTQTMSSLSFGSIDVSEGIAATTDIIPVTIHGGGSWSASHNFVMPSQELLRPDAGHWGPRLLHTVNGVGLVVHQTSSNTFDVHMTHNGVAANRGFAQGYLTFTNGSTTLRMPFGAYFNLDAPPVVLTAHLPNTGVWRSILSNHATTEENTNAFDPRAHTLSFDPIWSHPSENREAIMTQSNYTSLTFAFIDATEFDRAVRIYIGPYGSEPGDEDKILASTLNNVPPNRFITLNNVVRSVVGGETFGATGHPGVMWIVDGYVLEAGTYTVSVVVVNNIDHPDHNLVIPYTFIVTDEVPTVEFDEGIFTFEDGDTTVSVSGRLVSPAISLAMDLGLESVNTASIPNFIPVSFGAQQVVFDGMGTITLGAGNSTGEFMVNIPIPADAHNAPYQLFAWGIDGRGVGHPGGVLSWVSTHAGSDAMFLVAHEDVADDIESLVTFDYSDSDFPLTQRLQAGSTTEFNLRVIRSVAAVTSEAQWLRNGNAVGESFPLVFDRFGVAIAPLTIANALNTQHAGEWMLKVTSSIGSVEVTDISRVMTIDIFTSGGGGAGGGGSPSPSSTPPPTAVIDDDVVNEVEEVIVEPMIDEEIIIDEETLLHLLESGDDLIVAVDDAVVVIPAHVLAGLVDEENPQPITIDITVNHGNEDIDGLLAVEIYIFVGSNLIDELPSAITISISLGALELEGMNIYRIVAIIEDGTIIGGRYDTETGYFVFETTISGEFVIAYVEKLKRLSISLDSLAIHDLAENAELQVMDVLPFIYEGRIMLPIRFIADALGADIDFIGETEDSPAIISLQLGEDILTFAIGEMAEGMDVPSMLVNDRTMVSVRFVSEFFGALVDWDEDTRSVEIII